MAEPVWWPSEICKTSIEDSQSTLLCRTSFGKTSFWDYSPLLDSQWWQQNPEDGVCWGDWPQNAKSIAIICEDKDGILAKLSGQDEQWMVRVCPLDVGQDVSRMVRHKQWNLALQGSDILLPIAGWSSENSDRVLIYPPFETVSGDEIENEMNSIVSSMADAHSRLEQFSTPNNEREWNDSLKLIEASLRTNTLWRGPHTRRTVGLPTLNFRLSSAVRMGDKVLLLAQPRRLVEHLLIGEQRIPAIANLMIMEREFANYFTVDESKRKEILETWIKSVPKKWTINRALSTVLGGPWLWRYRAVLLNLADATAFGESQKKHSCNQWLGDVSRLQAHLGTLRMWKAGQWAGYAAVCVGYYIWQMQTIVGQSGLYLILAGLLTGTILEKVYWSKDPPPY